MNAELKEAKQAIRAFWPNYSDERLVWLLAHARSGKLAFFSCCCFIGVATADHALRSEGEAYLSCTGHIVVARGMPAADNAENAFCALGYDTLTKTRVDAPRRRRIIPMVKAELRRRERERARLAGDTNHTPELSGVLLKS